MNKLCSIFFVLMMSLQLAAQAPDWYSAASRKAHYPQNDWYIGYVEGEQRENEDIEETFSRLKDDARAELATTIITTIKHSSQYLSRSDMQLSSNYFEENIKESIATETEISSFINDIPEVRPEIYRIPKGKSIAAFASLKKSIASNFYIRKIENINTRINEALVIIDYLIKNQERIKAGEELKNAKENLTQSSEYYKLLLIFGCNADKINTLQSQRTEIESKIRQKLSFLSLYTESICILCDGAAYDISCSQIVDKIKGNMSKLSCSFTDDPSQADWILNLRLKAETDKARSNCKEQFVKISIAGSAYCVNKKTTYSLYGEEYDSALTSIKAAEIIIRRGKIIDNISSDIINMLKSK